MLTERLQRLERESQAIQAEAFRALGEQREILKPYGLDQLDIKIVTEKGVHPIGTVLNAATNTELQMPAANAEPSAAEATPETTEPPAEKLPVAEPSA